MPITEFFLPHSEIILRLFLSAILGGLIGIERERTSWFAGLRTHMLVCVGSALIMIVSQFGFEDVLHKDLIVLDPSRIAAQVVSGIGFLGAGTILFWKNMIRGLTTAASLWAVAAIGLAIGGGLYVAAISTTLLILLILAGMRPIERRFFKKSYTTEIRLNMKMHVSLVEIENILTQLDINLANFQLELDKDKEKVHLLFKSISQKQLFALIDRFKQLPDIEKIEVS